MAFNSDMVDLVDERISQHGERALMLGTVVSGTERYLNTIMVQLDGSGLAVPVKAFRHMNLLPGARVGLAKFDGQWIVIGTFSTHTGPVSVANGEERGAMFSEPTLIPLGQQVYVRSTKELEIWDGTIWRGVTPRIVVRPVSESTTNDTGMSDDAYLKLPVEGGAKYKLTTFLTQDSGTVGDFRWAYGYPTGTTGFQSTGAGFFLLHPALADTDQTPVFQDWTITDAGVASGGESGAGNWRPIYAMTMFIAGQDGEVVLRWAQQTAEAATASIGAGSWLELWRVG